MFVCFLYFGKITEFKKQQLTISVQAALAHRLKLVVTKFEKETE